MTSEEIKAGLNTIKAIADTIKELKEVPSGTLYAQLMGIMTLDQYQRVIDILKRSGIVSESGNVLKWEVK